MKTLKWLIIIGVVLCVAFFGIPYFMPSTYKVERTLLINAPAEKIYPLIATPRAWPKWSIWNQRDPAMKLTFSGAESGAGAKWAWEGKEGNGNMEFTAADPNKSVTYALAFPDMGMNSRGVLSLTPEGNGTKVSWTNEGDVGRSAMGRWFVPFLDSMMGPDFSAGLANLKTLAEKP